MGETLRARYLERLEEFIAQPRDFKVIRSVIERFGIKGAGTIKANRKYRIMLGPAQGRWQLLGFTNRGNQEFYHGEHW